jgi:hypothetical protein
MAPRIETAEDLERIVAEQTATIKALGELVRGMDARIRALTALLDIHHEIFIAHGWAKPRPKEEDPIVN